MSRTVRVAVGAAILSWLSAGVAAAGPCLCPGACSDCPSSFIRVVGHDGVVGDPAGEYCVTIRDCNNVPVANDLVTVDLSACAVQLCADPLDPAVSVDCAAQKVSRRTDALGRACFRVIGKRQPDAGCSAPPVACVHVTSQSQGFICALFAPTFDLVNEGSVGLTGNDLSEFLHLFLECGVYLPAIDYNGNSVMDGDDLSEWLRVFIAGGSSSSCPAAGKCP